MSRRRRLQVSKTLPDRIVGWFSPTAGAQRMQARVAMAALESYAGARRGRGPLREWGTLAASADADTLPDLDTLRARARDLERNDPLARSAVSTKVVNVIGAGHKVLPEIDAKRLGLSAEAKEAWERDALAIWTMWADSRDCDITRTQTFAELEATVYASRLSSGDILALRRYKRRPGGLLGTSCQLVEADRLSNPDWQMDSDTLAGGVEMDADGAPIFYHVASKHTIDRSRTAKVEWKRIPAFGPDGRRLVLHIHGPRWRPDMTRYAPMLAPVIESLKQRSRYAEAELMAAVVSACFAVAMKSPEGMMSDGLAAATGEQGAAASDSIRLTEPGQIVDLAPDEQLQSFAPGRPNPGYEPFVTAIAREVGAGTDLPQELLLKHFQASYSASRAALEMAWQFFRVDRKHHVDQFCRPFYADVIGEAVARGLLVAPGFFTDPLVRAAWLGATWVGPGRPVLDPVKEATADRIELENRTTTRTRIAGRKGEDWEQLEEQRSREDARIAETVGPGTAPAETAEATVQGAVAREIAQAFADGDGSDTDIEEN